MSFDFEILELGNFEIGFKPQIRRFLKINLRICGLIFQFQNFPIPKFRNTT
jgi:hypothetical protein